MFNFRLNLLPTTTSTASTSSCSVSLGNDHPKMCAVRSNVIASETMGAVGIGACISNFNIDEVVRFTQFFNFLFVKLIIVVVMHNNKYIKWTLYKVKMH